MPSLLFSFQPPTGVADPRRDEISLASITRQLANLPSMRSRGELAALVQSPPFRFPRAPSNLSAVSYQIFAACTTACFRFKTWIFRLVFLPKDREVLVG